MTEPAPAPTIQHVMPSAKTPAAPSSLEDFRKKIDAVDSQLLLLLNQRAVIVQAVGELKKREGLSIYSPDREEQLLHRLTEQNAGPLSAESIRAIYREILSASRAVEKEMVIACLGPAAGITYQAACHRFGSSVKYVFYKETSDVFNQISKSEADYGVVPIDSSEGGPAVHTLDNLAETELSVCAEITLDGQEKSRAERFLVLSRTQNPLSGFDRTLIVLRVEDKAGALVSALEPFKEHAVNITYLAKRSASKGSKDVFFFVEADGHSQQLQKSDVFRELSKRCRAVKVLGSYPKQN